MADTPPPPRPHEGPSGSPDGGLPPPSGPPLPQPPSGPPARGLSTGAKVALGVAIALGSIVVIGILAAIAIPAFLNQQDRAQQAELTSAVRSAALEVEAAAILEPDGYAAIPDLAGLIDDTLQQEAGGRVAAQDSLLTYATADAFGVCAEHVDLPGSVIYLSDEGGLQGYVETPCP